MQAYIEFLEPLKIDNIDVQMKEVQDWCQQALETENIFVKNKKLISEYL